MHGILDSNSIASPQLVDYRLQSAIMGITTPAEFLATLGTNPCDEYTDPTENNYCMELLANSQFVGQLTDMTNGLLSGFQTCASTFATGGQDYQIIINEPNNATETAATMTTTSMVPNGVKRHDKRSFGVEEDYDLTRSMLEAIEYYESTAAAPLLGHRKSSGLQLIRKQLSTCSQTGVCFQTCPDCRDQQTYCGTQAAIITSAVCRALGAVTKVGVGALAVGACGSACGPAAPACAAICARLAGKLADRVVRKACAELKRRICDSLTRRCAECNSANNGICDSGSTQCCAGETGTRCGVGCCCCPACYAPGGINCACTAAPC